MLLEEIPSNHRTHPDGCKKKNVVNKYTRINQPNPTTFTSTGDRPDFGKPSTGTKGNQWFLGANWDADFGWGLEEGSQDPNDDLACDSSTNESRQRGIGWFRLKVPSLKLTAKAPEVYPPVN